MSEDVFKPAGASKSSKPDAGGGVVRNVPVFGIVKNNVDPTRSGRLQVYISDLGSDDPDNPDSWATVSYMSPFYGFVEPTAGEAGSGDFVANPASYGVWNSPPDLGSTVICIFINGDPNYGYYIGCAPKAEALHMVPAIGSSEQVIINNDGESQSFGGASQLPVTNINKNNSNIADNANFLDEPKPVHSYQASILFKQGLIRDTLRGPITSGAQRESPSRVGWGVSSPGRPIFAGGYTDANIADAAKDGKDVQGLTVVSRRGGHSIVLDDGDLIGRDQLMRFRTAAGHQILMSDDGQTIFIIHSNGQSWIEMGKEGTIDMFCTNSFNIRTQGDLNLHADNNINIHAKKKLNIKAEDIYIQSEKSTSHNVGTDYKVEVKKKYNLKVGDVMSFASGGIASFLSSSTTYINGSRINLNTGQGPAPDAVAPLVDIVHTDTLFDSTKGYIAAPGKLKSITSRAPAHAPWSNANQGVNIQTSPSAEKSLPSAPSSAVSKVADAAASTSQASPLSTAGLSTVPPVPAISKSIDPQTAGSLLGATATNAAAGPAAAAVASGAGLVPTTAGASAAIGSFAQNPTQLETGGFLKPGSAALVESLVKGGTPLNKSIVENVFTGKDGINNLNSLVSNPQAQISGVLTNLQKSQTALTNSGVLSGKEAPTAIAGMVLSGVTAGVSNTINTVKNLFGAGGTPKAGVPGVSSSVLTSMKSGNFAAGMAESSTGGLSSLMSTVIPVAGLIAGAKLQQRGATAAAFGVIAASLGSLPKGPVNLKTAASAGMDTALARATGLADPLKAASNILKTTGSIMGGQTGRVASAVSGGLNAINRFNSASTPAQQLGAVTGAIGSIGSIGAALGNKSVSKAARDVNNAIGAARSLDKGLMALANAKTTGQALGGLSNLVGSVGRTGAMFGNKNIGKTTSALTKVISSTNQIMNAANTLATSKNINQTLGSFSQIVNAAGRIAGATSKNSKSTGLFNIPGGQLSVGSIVNKSLGSLGIPKNPALGSIITNAVTSAVNNVAFPQAAKAAAGLTTPLTGAIAGMAAGAQGLAAKTLSGLSAGEAGPLNAAMSAIGFGGASALKLPSIGLNTNDTAAVSAQISSLLSDPRIPKPDFGEPDASAVAVLESVLAQNNQVDSIFTQLDTLAPEIEGAREEYYVLENSLPPGDPQIAQAREQWVALAKKYQEALDSVNNIIGNEEA